MFELYGAGFEGERAEVSLGFTKKMRQRIGSWRMAVRMK